MHRTRRITGIQQYPRCLGLAFDRRERGRVELHRVRRRVENPIIGDVVTFAETSEQTAGARTLLEIELSPGGGNTPHYHKTYAEHFRALTGRVIVEVDGVEQELVEGEEASAPAGTLHCFRNRSPDRAVFEVELRPGHEGFEKSLRVGYALAADGRTNKKAMPKNPMHAAVLLEWSEMRLPGIYRLFEQPLKLLARVARRRGVDQALERQYLAS